MTAGMRTIVYPVKDIAKAKALYGTLLGVPPSIGGQHIGLDPPAMCREWPRADRILQSCEI